MKRFILKVFFFFILLTSLTPLWFIIYYFTNQKVISKLKNISRYECLIMGDSQMQRINPEYFVNKCYNFASHGEHFFITYQKIKRIVNFKECNVKQIILGVSAHNFAPVYTRLFDTKFSEGKNSLNRYFYFIDKNELFNKFDIFNIPTINNIIRSQPQWGGLHESLNGSPDTTIINMNFNMHYGEEKVYSSSQVYSLNEIVDFCLENKIELFLISTPYHPDYLRKVDDYYFNILKSTVKEYRNVTYMNFIDPNIDVKWMSDGNHLNVKGAKVYSKLINDTINVRPHTNVYKE